MCSEYSVSEYNRFLDCLEKRGLNGRKISDIELYISGVLNLKKPDGSFLSLNTQRSYLVASHWYARAYSKNANHESRLKEEIERIRLKVDTEVKSNKLLGNQVNTYLSWDKIMSVYEKLGKDYARCERSHTTYILLSLYVLLCPRRLKDYALMYISADDINYDSKKNYYVISKNYFVFSNYKTSKFYKMQYISVPSNLKALLLEYISKYKKTDSLLNLSTKAIRTRLSRLFQTETGKSLGVNTLRHSYISWMKDNGKLNGNESIVSQIMGHSVSTQNDYYKKVAFSSDSASSSDSCDLIDSDCPTVLKLKL